MRDNKPQNIDYYIYENEMFRMERQVKRWVIAFWIVFVSLVASNTAWLIGKNS